MLSTELITAFVLVAVSSYLLGSLNFALILSKFLVGDDIRKHGSGNAGMTNILRTYGKKLAVATAAGDFLKALAAIFIARYVFFSFGITAIDGGYVGGLFVVLGHLFPVFFRFKGGKGVVVSLGVMCITDPVTFLIMLVIFLPIVFGVKIVSLASVLGALAYPVLTYVRQRFWGIDPVYNTIFAAIISLIVLISHRANIKRLLSGTEPRFGSKKQ